MPTLNKYQTRTIIAQLSEIEQFITQMRSLNSEEAREMCRGYAFARIRHVREALLNVAVTDIEVESPALEAAQ